MRKIYLSVVLLFLLTSVVGAAFPSELDKKVKKRVAKLFSPGPVFTEIPVAGAVTGSEALYKEGDQLWAINSSGGVLGYVISTRAKGRYDYFDYSVIFTKDLSVMSVMVTTYRSSHGAGICSKGWLNQFSGYRGEEMRLGKEVDSISGATISATSIVEDIRRCYLVMDKLRSSGGL
ncbi:MAG: FMN-binding protein [Bacteroidetes bacterium]|nr:FMN-binding protein [Bacteroidota bacterium]